jgi:hypothetical protein
MVYCGSWDTQNTQTLLDHRALLQVPCKQYEHNGQLATLDHKLATEVVPDGKAFLALI